MPLYVCSVLPRKDFEKIYDIQCINYIRITIEHYKSNQIKICYRCQGHGHSSEKCTLSPACLKCAGPHLTRDCPHIGRIVPKCVNCKGEHVASFRGCPMNPTNKKTTKSVLSKPQNNSNDNNQLNNEICKILDKFNYTKTKDITTNSSEKENSDHVIQLGQSENTTEETDEMGTHSNYKVIQTGSESPQNTSPFSDIKDLFTSFKDLKEILKLTKLLKTIKNIIDKTKNHKNNIDRIVAFINEFDNPENDLSAFLDD